MQRTAFQFPDYSISQLQNSPLTRLLNSLSVDVSKNDVDGADGGDDVGDQASFAHFGKSLQVRERGGTHVYAIRFSRTVADHVITHLTARRFHRLVHLAGRNSEALGDDLEVIDQGFHLRLHFLAVGQDDFGRGRFDRAFGHAVKRLLHDSDGLAQLLHATHVSVEDITFFAERDLELKILVAAVRRVAAQIDVDTAAAQSWAAGAERDGVLGCDSCNTLGAHPPDRISGQQVLVFIDLGRESGGKVFGEVKESQRRLEGYAADAEVRGHHALAADHLEHSQDVFAFPEAIEKHRHRTDVHGMGAEPDQVRVDAAQFVQQNAQPLRLGRDLQTQEF